MVNYRRYFVPGGSYFFTVNLAERSGMLLIEYIHALRKAWREVRHELPFKTEAIVVLPDHLHCIWTLPPKDADFSSRWRKIKAGFSRQLPKTERRSASRLDKGERGIWQRRFWEHAVRDETDWQRHVDYIHYNPVKHGHVKRVIEWRYSTFHRYVRLEVYPPDWAGVSADEGDVFGEA